MSVKPATKDCIPEPKPFDEVQNLKLYTKQPNEPLTDLSKNEIHAADNLQAFQRRVKNYPLCSKNEFVILGFMESYDLRAR